jgi:hypothetical protein
VPAVALPNGWRFLREIEGGAGAGGGQKVVAFLEERIAADEGAGFAMGGFQGAVHAFQQGVPAR